MILTSEANRSSLRPDCVTKNSDRDDPYVRRLYGNQALEITETVFEQAEEIRGTGRGKGNPDFFFKLDFFTRTSNFWAEAEYS